LKILPKYNRKLVKIFPKQSKFGEKPFVIISNLHHKLEGCTDDWDMKKE
jgi:hypothetical protein